jgi:hypothetical protein
MVFSCVNPSLAELNRPPVPFLGFITKGLRMWIIKRK